MIEQLVGVVADVKSDLAKWQDKTERNIERRYRFNLLVQLATAVVAAIVALIAAKLIPWFNMYPPTP